MLPQQASGYQECASAGMAATSAATISNAASGHAAAPPSSVMNSRRLMSLPKPEDETLAHQWKLLCVTASWTAPLPDWVKSGCPTNNPPHDRFDLVSGPRWIMSGCLTGATSGCEQSQQGSRLFDDLVGDGEQHRWHGEAEHLGCREVDD